MSTQIDIRRAANLAEYILLYSVRVPVVSCAFKLFIRVNNLCQDRLINEELQILLSSMNQ